MLGGCGKRGAGEWKYLKGLSGRPRSAPHTHIVTCRSGRKFALWRAKCVIQWPVHLVSPPAYSTVQYTQCCYRAKQKQSIGHRLFSTFCFARMDSEPSAVRHIRVSGHAVDCCKHAVFAAYFSFPPLFWFCHLASPLHSIGRRIRCVGPCHAHAMQRSGKCGDWRGPGTVTVRYGTVHAAPCRAILPPPSTLQPHNASNRRTLIGKYHVQRKPSSTDHMRFFSPPGFNINDGTNVCICISRALPACALYLALQTSSFQTSPVTTRRPFCDTHQYRKRLADPRENFPWSKP